MKTISKFMLSGKVLFSALVVCFIVLGTSCKKENTDPVKKCDTEGRFTYVEGAGGFYGNYVITLNSGETILPGEVTDNSISPDAIYDNMAITLSYTLIKTDFTNGDENKILPGGCIIKQFAKITCLGEKDQIEPIGWCGTR
jgi:hypothetical protein